MAPSSRPSKAKPGRGKTSTAPSKKTKPSQKTSAPNEEDCDNPQNSLPLELQQLLLDIFRNSFFERLNSDVGPLLQEVKQHLQKRHFIEAFSRQDYLEAYAARWSPSRALAYLQIFSDVLPQMLSNERSKRGKDLHSSDWSLKIACLGGGAGAEVVALAGFLKILGRTPPISSSEIPSETSASAPDDLGKLRIDVHAIDIAWWELVLSALCRSVLNPPPISQYASAAAKATNVPLISSSDFTCKFTQQDLLSSTEDQLSSLLKNTDVVTLLFTLNELETTSLAKTQLLLLRLTEVLQPGTTLLVVDSPGSYSTVKLNGRQTAYPMHWLLRHTLLRSAKDAGPSDEPTDTAAQGAEDKEGQVKWEEMQSDSSRWFRLPKELKYPIELEDMRYQIHLYRRL